GQRRAQRMLEAVEVVARARDVEVTAVDGEAERVGPDQRRLERREVAEQAGEHGRRHTPSSRRGVSSTAGSSLALKCWRPGTISAWAPSTCGMMRIRSIACGGMGRPTIVQQPVRGALAVARELRAKFFRVASETGSHRHATWA